MKEFIMLLLGNIGEGCDANTEISLELKTLNHRNAYQLKLEREYNTGKSVRHPDRVKMYADLTQNKKCKKLGIKSLSGNNVYLYFKDIYFRGKLVAKRPCDNAKIKLDPAKYLNCV